MLQIFLCCIFWLPLLTRNFLSPLKVCGFDDGPRRARSKVTLEKIRSIKYLAYANVCHTFSMFFYRYSLTCDHLPPTEPPNFSVRQQRAWRIRVAAKPDRSRVASQIPHARSSSAFAPLQAEEAKEKQETNGPKQRPKGYLPNNSYTKT